MAYRDFNLNDIEDILGVSNQIKSLFSDLSPLNPSQWLKQTLAMNAELPIRSEKAKSEMIIFPILAELRQRNHQFFTIYSGENLNVDEELGLKGECDFILAKDIASFSLNYPIISVVEAKKNDTTLGIAQCGAQLIAARQFNEKKGHKLSILYGCVTTADDWLFLKLEKNILFIDTKKYYLVEIGEVLAIFQTMIDYYKSAVTE